MGRGVPLSLLPSQAVPGTGARVGVGRGVPLALVPPAAQQRASDAPAAVGSSSELPLAGARAPGSPLLKAGASATAGLGAPSAWALGGRGEDAVSVFAKDRFGDSAAMTDSDSDGDLGGNVPGGKEDREAEQPQEGGDDEDWINGPAGLGGACDPSQYDPTRPNNYEAALRLRKLEEDARWRAELQKHREEEQEREEARERQGRQHQEQQQQQQQAGFAWSAPAVRATPATAATSTSTSTSGAEMDAFHARIQAMEAQRLARMGVPAPAPGDSDPPRTGSLGTVAPVAEGAGPGASGPASAPMEGAWVGDWAASALPTRRVAVVNCCAPSEVDDADLRSDLREGAESFGAVDAVEYCVDCVDYAAVIGRVPSGGDPSEQGLVMCVTFRNPQDAASAVAGLRGRFFSRRELGACFVSESSGG